jgi:hypothetical protein
MILKYVNVSSVTALGFSKSSAVFYPGFFFRGCENNLGGGGGGGKKAQVATG